MKKRVLSIVHKEPMLWFAIWNAFWLMRRFQIISIGDSIFKGEKEKTVEHSPAAQGIVSLNLDAAVQRISPEGRIWYPQSQTS